MGHARTQRKSTRGREKSRPKNRRHTTHEVAVKEISMRHAARALHAGHGRVRAIPESSMLNRFGWSWDPVLTTDENYLDLAFLFGRGCGNLPQVGCVIVTGIDDGSRRGDGSPQGRIIASGINSFLVWDTQYGRNNGKSGRRKPDCHAEANAVAESAMRGIPLLSASCYVSKPPCLTCYTLLAASGIREIVCPEPMLPKQTANAQDLGIEQRVLPCSSERKQKRDALTKGHVDQDLVAALRDERALRGSERYRANLRRLEDLGALEVT
jgi:deoxycytidylate deaminase